MTEGGGGIDELEGDLFLGGTVGDRNDGLSESDDSLLDSWARTSEHEEVLVDNTIVGVSTNGGDVLGGKIKLSLDLSSLSDLVHLLVNLGSVVVSVLTGTGDAVANSRWMPCSNTGNLAETLVSLTGQFGGSPTGGNTFEALTLGGGKSVDQLVLSEDRVNRDLLLKEGLGELDLTSGVSTIDLDLHDVSTLLSKLNKTDLGVSNDSDNRAVLGNLFELSVDALLTLISTVLLGVLGEGLLLRAVPVAVKTSEELLTQVLGPDCGESTESGGGGNVSDNTNNVHWGSLDDGDGLNDLLLVELSSRTLNLTDDLVHTGLVSQEGSKVRRGGSVIARELSDLSSVLLGSLARQESE